jgi:hypothetical protein
VYSQPVVVAITDVFPAASVRCPGVPCRCTRAIANAVGGGASVCVGWVFVRCRVLCISPVGPLKCCGLSAGVSRPPAWCACVSMCGVWWRVEGDLPSLHECGAFVAMRAVGPDCVRDGGVPDRQPAPRELRAQGARRGRDGAAAHLHPGAHAGKPAAVSSLHGFLLLLCAAASMLGLVGSLLPLLELLQCYDRSLDVPSTKARAVRSCCPLDPLAPACFRVIVVSLVADPDLRGHTDGALIARALTRGVCILCAPPILSALPFSASHRVGRLACG